MTAIVTIPVSDTCEHKSCSDHPAFAYVVAGEVGKDGVAVYCDRHSQSYADPSGGHTAIAEVKQ